MKKVLLITLSIVLVSVVIGQTITVKEAMNLIGQSKDIVFKKVRATGYVYKGMDLDFHKFSKNELYAVSELTIGMRNNACNAISWSVSALHASSIMGDVLRSGFQVNEEATSGYVQAFKHFGKGLILTLIDRSAYDNTIIVNVGRMASGGNGDRQSEMHSRRSTAPKAVFSGPSTRRAPSFFQGTKRFCDEDYAWSYVVTIKGDSITLRLYPGKNNDYHKDKTKVRETVRGRIIDGFIVTKDPPEYLTNRFKFEEGRLLKMNNEGEYNEFDQCQ